MDDSEQELLDSHNFYPQIFHTAFRTQVAKSPLAIYRLI